MSLTLSLDEAISSIFVDGFGLFKGDSSAEDVEGINCCLRQGRIDLQAILLMGTEVGSA